MNARSGYMPASNEAPPCSTPEQACCSWHVECPGPGGAAFNQQREHRPSDHSAGGATTAVNGCGLRVGMLECWNVGMLEY